MTDTNTRSRWLRWGSAITLGVMIQSTGCALDGSQLAAQWAVAIADQFFTSYAYDLLNLGSPSLFSLSF